MALMTGKKVCIMIIAVQGSMAVGKTTLLKRLDENIPQAKIIYEDNRSIRDKIKKNAWDSNHLKDYVAIQKLYIEQEINRFKSYSRDTLVFVDLGPEEIFWYSLYYPLAAGKPWNILDFLSHEIQSLQSCFPQWTLFLDADDKELRKRKENDDSRQRRFFNFQLEKLLPLKRDYFLGKENVIVLNTSQKSEEAVYQEVLDWLRREKLI